MISQMSYSSNALETLNKLQHKAPKKYRKVIQKLKLLQLNQRHPGLNTHKFKTLTGPNGEPMFEAYVEKSSKASVTLRVFWYYSSSQGSITVFAINAHP